MGRVCRCIFFILACLSPLSLFAMPTNCVVGTNVYYISQAGSDANTQAQATSKATAWRHAPYMNSFGGKYSHTPGDCFIFRGGDTWVATDYVVIPNGGSSGSPDYYGVDQSWYSGSAWARPIFDIGGNLPHIVNAASRIWQFNASYVTVDNWEIIHGTCNPGTAAQYYFNRDAVTGIVVTNGYYHAFQPPSGGCGSGTTTDGNAFDIWIYEEVSASGDSCNGSFDHNIVDGTDGSGAQGYATVIYDPAPCDAISFNVVHDICSGFGGNFTLAHDNQVYNFGGSVSGALDCTRTGLHDHAIRSNNDADVYNNVIHDTNGEAIMVNPNGNSGHPVSHIYNNVLFHNGTFGGATPITAIQTGDNAPNTSGVVEIYNNTIDCDSDGGYGSCIHIESPINTVTVHNEHHMLTSGAPAICINNPPFNCGSGGAANFSYNASDNLFETLAAANAAGYTSSQPFVYSPTSANSPTVGIATNSTTLCASDMPSLCKSSTYGALQGGGTLTAPATTPNPRPVSGGWNAGAYQFAGTSSTPNPPTGLAAAVQ